MPNMSNFKTNELSQILLLDEEEALCYNKYKSLEGIIITKIMDFDKNFNKAIEYMLDIMKNIYIYKYSEIYKNNILDILKNVLFENLNNIYFITFVNNLYKYKNKDYLLTYFKYLSEKEFFEFLSNINILPKYTRYELLNILTKSTKIRNLLLKKSINGYNYDEIDINLFSLLKFKNDFDINDDNYVNIIKNYLNDDISKRQIMDYINDILDKNKLFGYTTFNISAINNLSSSVFLVLVLKIILIIFSNIDKNNIFKNTTNTNKDFKSTLRKEYIPDINDTEETKIYLMALKALRMIYNTNVLLYIELKDNNNVMMSLFDFQQRHIIQEKIKQYRELIFSRSLNKLLNELISYYMQDFLLINSDAIDTVIQYHFNMTKINKDYKYSKESIEYLYKLLSVPNEYCNHNYKFDILMLIFVIYENNQYLLADIDLLKGIILYYDENDIFKLHDGPLAHKFYQISLKTLEKIISTSNSVNANNDNNKELSMNDLFLKFFYKINSHTISHLEFLNSVCTEIAKKLNDYNLESFRTKCMTMIKEVMKSIDISLKVVNEILDKKLLNPEKFRGEIILCVITLAINVLKFFTNGKIAIYDVFNMNFEALNIMKLSLYILHKLRVNSNFTYLIQDYKKLIIESLPYIKFYDFEQNIKIELKETLEKKNNNNNDNDNYNDNDNKDIPDEFLDPLIYILIKDPIMIPNVDLIFDKTSIMSQIYHEKINPYTRDFLDESIIEVHNKKPEIITKITEFTNRLNKWNNISR